MRMKAFIYEAMGDFASFGTWWTIQHQKDSEGYPMELLEGDWEEQFDFWRHNIKDKDEASVCAPPELETTPLKVPMRRPLR